MPKKNNSQEYWAKRRQQDKIKVIKEGEKGIDNLKRLLKINLDDVQAKIKFFYEKYGENPAEKMNYSEWQKYKAKLSKKAQENPQDEFLQRLAKQNIPKYQIDRLRALELDLQMQLTETTNGQAKGIYNTLDDVARISQSVLAKSIQASIGLKFNTIASKKLKQLLSSDWSGANWSDRLWHNRAIVGEKVAEILQKGVTQGTSLQKMARELKQATNQSFNNAFRLIRTETSHIDGQVTLEGYKQAGDELGLEYYEYDAFLDSRTSTICRDLDKKRFKVSEAEVGINYPPMHPNCRSTTQLVLDEDYKQQESRSENPNNSKEEVKNKDTATVKENLTAQNVFAKENAKNSLLKVSEDNKNLRNILLKDKDLLQYTTLNAKYQKRTSRYIEKCKDYNKLWKKTGDYKYLKNSSKYAKLYEENKKLLYTNQNKIIDKSLNTYRFNNGGSVFVKGTEKLTNISKNLETDLKNIIHKDLIKENTIKTTYKKGRANFNPIDKKLHLDPNVDRVRSTTLHETMHWLEDKNPEIMQKSIAFLEYRTQGETAKSLKELTGNKAYKPYEIAKKDKFYNPYCGRIYKDKNDNYYGTEILSMGFERAVKDPINFIKEDPEYYDFVIGILHNKI